MTRLRPYFRSFILVALTLSLEACVPKQGGGSSSSDKSSEASALTVSTVRVGAGSAYNAEIYNGDYYSKYDPVTVNGTCKGDVEKILVQDTPQGGATSSQTVNCSNGTFTWTKSYSTQKLYALVFTPQDGNAITISSVSPISKNYTYDSTNPAAPTYVSPSITNSYTITNGVTSITIAGQVLNEVVKMVGPYSLNMPLMADPDGIHKNFVFNATVPLSSSVNFTFTGSDAAGNSAASTMTIDSVLNLSIPVAAQELGGSNATSGNLKIESTIGFMSEVIINSNVKHVTGSSGIIGNL